MDIAKDILDRIGQPESELLEYKSVLPPAATVAARPRVRKMATAPAVAPTSWAAT